MSDRIWDGDPDLSARTDDERRKFRAQQDLGWGRTPPEQPWPQFDPAALHGLAGEVVTTLSPHTESDPVAILLQLLAMVGNATGRGPHYLVEGDFHYLNLFALLVGETARARKGTSLGRVRQIMAPADSDWERTRIVSGLSSGEGVIWAVRDPVISRTKDKKTGIEEEKTIDEGITDKRLCVIESEFARVLAVIKRDGNTLSPILRDAWDRGQLAILTKNSPARATGAHISIVAHITAEELRRDLDSTTIANGFSNRFLIACVRRARLLPFGGALDAHVVLGLAGQIHFAIEGARQLSCLAFDPSAAQLWKSVYGDLSEGRPGLFGAATARGDAQVVRLATLYAALDRASDIARPHLEAALALWRYCSDSVRYLFGDALGDPIADEILRALRLCAPDGMSRNEIRELFDRNRSSDRIGAALGLLIKHGLVRWSIKGGNGAGRPPTVWFAT
jgi:Protein of unknown function (DUF3987)